MQYNQPFDQPLIPNAPFVNGNPGTGVAGSIPPAAALEFPQREIVNAVTAGGLTPSNADLDQLTRVIRGGQLDYSIDYGTADALIAHVSLAHTAILAGLPFAILKSGAGNATSTPTLTIADSAGYNGFTATVVKANGSPLAPGDLPAHALIVVRAISPTQFALVSLLTSSDILNVVSPQVQSGEWLFAVASGTDTYTATLSPAPSELVEGMQILIYFGNTNTSTTPTLNINGLGAKTIVNQFSLIVEPGDVYCFVPLVYDGYHWRLLEISYSDIFNYFAPRVQQGQIVFCSASGTDTYTGSLYPVPSSFTTGMEILVYFANGNDTTTPTLNLNGLGAKRILKSNGTLPSPNDIYGFIPLALDSFGDWLFSGLALSDVTTKAAALVVARLVPPQFKTTSYQIVASDENTAIIYAGTTNATFTLPSPSSVPPGWSVTVNNNTGQVLSLTTPSGQIQGVVTAVTQAIQVNQSISLANDGTNWFLAYGGNISNASVSIEGSSYAISPIDRGKLIVYQTAANATWGLPAPSAVYNGFAVSIFNNSSYQISLSAGSFVIVNPGNSGNTMIIPSYQSITLMCDGSAWYLDGGYYAPQATVNSTSGFTVRADGLIEQWGFVLSSGTVGNNVAITFPISFPNNTLTIDVQPSGNTSGYTAVNANNSSFTFTSTLANTGHFWRALGY